MKTIKSMEYKNSSITEFVIPEGVTKIESEAFKGCEALKEIVIPTSVTEIGEEAFFGCHNLTSVTIEGVTNIGKSAFYYCSSLKNVTIEGVTSIGANAFYGCESLTAITIPDSVTSIGHDAFADCKNLERITFPHKEWEMENSVCRHCYNLKQIDLGFPHSVADWAFEDCGIEAITIPDGVESIGCGAFKRCKNLKEIILNTDLERIVEDSFEDTAYYENEENWENDALYIDHCLIAVKNDIKEVTVEKGCRLIADAVFYGCHALEKIKIPNDAPFNESTFDWCEARILLFQEKQYTPLTEELYSMSQGVVPGCGLKEWVDLSSDMLDLGIHPFYEKDWAEPSIKEIEVLSQAFREKFSRMPKVINEIALAHKILNLSTEDIINNFSIKGFKKALQKCNNNAFIAIVALLGAGKDLLHKFPVATSYEMGLSHPVIRNWVRKHPDSFELLPRIKGMETEINKDMSVSKVKELLVTKRARNDLKKIEAQYDFTFADCKCEIEQKEVELERLIAHLLVPSDLRQITVGYDTCCCQHYGGAGETAMMYGLMSATAGFWVIEDSKGGIKAQAEVWLTKDKSTFVFDNIEFANDRNVSDYEDIIKLWAQDCPYPNVILGMGYTEINLDCPECGQPEQPPVEGLEYVYTDTYSCVCLKKDGELTW